MLGRFLSVFPKDSEWIHAGKAGGGLCVKAACGLRGARQTLYIRSA